jgi:putative methylase
MLTFKKRSLEMLLSTLTSFERPRIMLEQYTTPPRVASEMLFLAAFINDDIRDRRVLDLGSGNGCLAIGAKLIGAKETVGVEIDPDIIRLAVENARKIGVNIEWINAPIDVVLPLFDTIIMNPPFGTKKEHADREFLKKAMETGEVIYSIHKTATRDYVIKYIHSMERKVDTLLQMRLEIPHSYEFHTKRRELIEVDLFRITRS